LVGLGKSFGLGDSFGLCDSHWLCNGLTLILQKTQYQG